MVSQIVSNPEIFICVKMIYMCGYLIIVTLGESRTNAVMMYLNSD